MSGRRRKVPSYCHHKASGQAYVTIDGREHYLGKYGTPASKENYARLIAERFTGPSDTNLPVTPNGAEFTVDELVLRYWTEHVESYYCRDGKPSERQCHIRLALRPLCDLYGNTQASEFSPRKLKTVRNHMIADRRAQGKSPNRSYINDHCGIIKRRFRWAVSEELVDVAVFQALATVESVAKGRDRRVRESVKIRCRFARRWRCHVPKRRSHQSLRH